VIRDATPDDAVALSALDRRNFSFQHTPVAPRERPFDTTDVLVYETDGELAGYAKISRLWDMPSVDHVRELRAVAVDAPCRRRGIARALLDAAIDRARTEGARKVTLRVLGHNAPARALYTACGFAEEGTLRGLFHLEGEYVDDILMSLDITRERRGSK
jgi:ribosomal protein S18 acetylase RimI-like enzyme